MSANTNAPLGVVFIARHGDRLGFYQSPTTYTASDTVVTPLGEVQNYQLGQMLRSIYTGSDASRAISGLSSTTFNGYQINATADAGGEGSVIYDSALALWQGFYPPNEGVSEITLANGTNVTSPLNGYQYVQVNTVIPDDDVTFEPWTNCNTWANRTTEFYNSAGFLAKQNEEAGFLNMLKTSGIVGNRSVTLPNMYNVFDYMNVNSIHNATYAAELNATGAGTLAHVSDLASYHEYGLFTDSSLGGLGNIAGRTLFNRIIGSLETFTESDNEVKIAHYHMAYKPFLSLFNMTNIAAATNPVFEYPYAMVGYASVAVFEIRDGGSGSSGYDVRFGFKNGSSTATDVTYYPLFGSSNIDTDLATFMGNLEPYLIPNNTDWCSLCSNNGSVDTCSEWALTEKYESLYEQYMGKANDSPSRAGAGGIGAGVTIVVGLALLGLMRAFGLISFGKHRPTKHDRYPLNEHGAGSYKEGSVSAASHQ
ncbi:hypothetical protein JCM21900_002951 [Sporobolomyces salmonicolor]